LASLLAALKVFALEYKEMPTLGFTHFQPAQLTTVGKRGTLWMQDLLLDYEEVTFALSNAQNEWGQRGPRAPRPAFLSLFDGDHEKVKALDQISS
jgi:adenylosuccinate lyase